MSDITFPITEELEADLASGDQSLPMGVLGAHSERFPSNLEVEASPQASSKRNPLILDSGTPSNLFSLPYGIILWRTKAGEGRRMKSLKTSTASLI